MADTLGLAPNQIAQFREAFDASDKDSDGCRRAREVGPLIPW
jgi:Ca2+-binding EF-hand superfamily protein